MIFEQQFLLLIQIYDNKIDKNWRGGECQRHYGEWHLLWLRPHSDFAASSAQSNGASTGALPGNRVANLILMISQFILLFHFLKKFLFISIL